MKNLSTIGIILAAGDSTRFVKGNKLLASLGGKAVIHYSLKAFDDSLLFKEILLVVDNRYQRDFEKITSQFASRVPIRIVIGGKSRQESVYCGLKSIDYINDYVVIHDGARPFIDKKNITDVLLAAVEVGASSLGIHPNDLIKLDDSNGFVITTISKKKAWLVQTPQAFKWHIIMQAHSNARSVNYAEDDASLVENMGCSVKMVNGVDINIKITTPFDLALAENIVKRT